MATPNYGSAEFQEAVAAIVETKTYNWIADINTSFLLTSGYLVFMMQLGFALVRIKLRTHFDCANVQTRHPSGLITCMQRATTDRQSAVPAKRSRRLLPFTKQLS